MGYDDVLEKLGGFGRYQKRIYFLICLPGITCAFHKLVSVFLLAKPNFRCQLPFENDTASYKLSERIWNLSYPIDSFTNTYSTCEYFNVNYTEDHLDGELSSNRSMTCSNYIYDDSKYENSALTEWNLVCNRAWMKATSDSLFMLGVLLGSIIFGQMSDKYGRKPIFFASLVAQVIFGILAGIAPEYLTYTISRLIIGATTSGVFLVAYVIAMEMVGPNYRLFAGVVCMMFFSVGFMLLAGFAYYVTDWRQLQIAVTLPGIIFMCYHWFVPESARWLLSKGRKESAKEIIKHAAKENKIEISDELLDSLLEDDIGTKKLPLPGEREASVFDMLRYPNLRKKSLLIFFDWFVNSGTYYALSWNTNNLGGNDLINFVISGAVEIPAYTFLLCTLNRWGRRSILCGCMLFSGTMLLLTCFVPDNQNWLLVVLAMLGKLAITSSYGTIYIFSAEQFPTVIRNVGLGAASMFARVGGIMAPYLNLTGDIWKPLPMIICGALAFLGGLLSLLLPETHNKPLLETIEDGENFGKKQIIEDPTRGQELIPLNEEQPHSKQLGNAVEQNDTNDSKILLSKKTNGQIEENS